MTQAGVRHEAFLTVVVPESAHRPSTPRKPAAESTAAPASCTG